jgi:hypothetical protein
MVDFGLRKGRKHRIVSKYAISGLTLTKAL